MYIRVTRNHVEPSRVDDALALVPDTVAAMRRLPGCQHVHTGVDRTSGQGISLIGITIFDTEEHARFSRDEALTRAVSRLRELGVSFEPPEVYAEVE